MNSSSTEISIMPTLMPGAERDVAAPASALPRRLAKAVRELARVLIRMPNQATP